MHIRRRGLPSIVKNGGAIPGFEQGEVIKMGSLRIFRFNKLLWMALFTVTLILYASWLLLM